MNGSYWPINDLRERIFPNRDRCGFHRRRSTSRVPPGIAIFARARLWRRSSALLQSLRNHTVSTQFASRLSSIAFATVAIRGLLEQADFFGTIQTALVSLGAFYVLGLVVGEAARRLVEENAKADLAERLSSAAASGTPVPPA